MNHIKIYIFFLQILVYTSSALSSPPCGLYGAPPCQFLPAPPGHTPSCARPGKTYCEHVDNYPTYLIKHLVHKWGFEAKNLLVDETWDDFASVAWHETPVFYDPAYIFPQRHYNGNANDFSGYKYITPPLGGVGGGKYSDDSYRSYSKQPTTEQPTFLFYGTSGSRLNLNKNQVNPFHGNLKSTPNNPTYWLKRIVRDISHGYTSAADSNPLTAADKTKVNNTKDTETEGEKPTTSRDVSLNMDLLDIVGVNKEDSNSRSKRQSPGRSTLCQTTSQFITPQAALNSKGNWMFVVNEANTARQMVKAELCA
ncbi:protein spaetzle 5-like [Teleopsis dalmanni]|uniref:protein spaetzle 5-like n=1 Tax=Teleopsis dalmanni TaxID=139649 RepID=UPI0018CC88D2|nr:protein spaetzle 5-like [Teleopsis dalmanni]